MHLSLSSTNPRSLYAMAAVLDPMFKDFKFAPAVCKGVSQRPWWMQPALMMIAVGCHIHCSPNNPAQLLCRIVCYERRVQLMATQSEMRLPPTSRRNQLPAVLTHWNDGSCIGAGFTIWQTRANDFFAFQPQVSLQSGCFPLLVCSINGGVQYLLG